VSDEAENYAKEHEFPHRIRDAYLAVVEDNCRLRGELSAMSVKLGVAIGRIAELEDWIARKLP
jgi:hypothetical protein